MPSPSARSSASDEPRTATDERRAFPRYPVDWEVVCKALAAGQRDSWQARALNVSAGGLGVVLERRFERGTTLTVQLQHAPAEAPRTLLARVMHATRLPDGGWLHGLSLLRPLHEEQLRAWGVGPARPERPDSRAWVRLACAMEAVCAEVADGGPAPWRGQVLDLSPSGLGLASARAVETGSHLTIDLRPARGQAARRLLVRVAHVKQQDEATWLLGCEFTQQLNEADLTALAEPAADEEGPGAVEDNSAPDTAVHPAADPDLARLCAAWPALPARSRAAILALLTDVG